MNRENANKIHTTIRFFKEMFPDEFEKTDIICCEKCNSVGYNSYDFRSSNICGNCKGIGFLGFEKIKGKYTCTICNGSGCNICHYEGWLDWVAAAMRPDLRFKAKEKTMIKEIENIQPLDQF